MTEHDLALRLEWLMRTGGADALAFGVACLAGPEAALPHGSPGERPVLDRAVLLFDFGAQVAGYRSDMTRTLFVGEPTRARPRGLRAGRARAGGGHRGDRDGRRGRDRDCSGRAADAVARDRDRRRRPRPRTSATGRGTASASPPTRHPASARARRRTPLPSPTVFSVEPGVYLDGETGVRIEDLVALDVAARTAERLTRFPRDVIVVGG